MKFREIIKGLLNEATPDEIYIKYYSDLCTLNKRY